MPVRWVPLAAVSINGTCTILEGVASYPYQAGFVDFTMRDVPRLSCRSRQ